jgi:hypothetical protein
MLQKLCQNKIRKYKQYSFIDNINYEPFIIEEFGAIHKKALPIFNQLCIYIASRHNKEIYEIKHHYTQLLSSILTRCNSRTILSRFY